MTNFLRLTSLAAASAVLALTSTPAAAQQVGVSGAKPTATARIIRPLTLTGVRDLDFGTVVLGAVPAGGSSVSLTAAGVLSCGTGLTCSGANQTAQYNVTGTQGQVVVVSATNSLLTGSNGGTLNFVPAVPANITMPNSGAPGQNFDVGGSITIVPATTDGVYSGEMEVFVQYQ